MKSIKRLLQKEINEALTFFPAIGILGPRQVGKTTLAKIIQDASSKKMVYLDLENPNDQVKLQNPSLFFETNDAESFIIDEIQLLPSLFPILRSIIDQNRNPGRFILLGSASLDIIQNSAEFLSGRIAYFELSPFNLLEIENKNISLLSKHHFKGGYPNAFEAPNDKLSQLWLKNYIKTYVERDLPLLGLPSNPILINRFLSMIAHSHGTILNKSTFAKSLGISIPTVSTYLNFLEGAFLIRTLAPWFINIKKRLVKSPKIYIRDSGILHEILNINDYEVLLGHIIIGNSWEGYAIEQIINALGSDYQYGFYRTQEGSECDLVISKGIEIQMAIEIKFSNAPKLTKGNKLAFKTLNAKEKYIITPNSDSFQIDEGIKCLSLVDFLLSHRQ